MTSALLPIIYEPPLVAPSRGLYDAVNWLADGAEPVRFLATGVDIQLVNTQLDEQFGVWGETWCADPDAISTDKVKDRLDKDFNSFEGLTIYGFDHNQCGDMTEAARSEVRGRALNALTLNEQRAAETMLATRMLTEIPDPPNYKGNLIQAISYLEAELAKKGVTGYIHLGAQWAAYAANDQLIVNGRTPMGHALVFGGGYVDSLGYNLIATTQPVGWRGPVSLRDAYKYELNQYVAVAERSLLIGYEAVLASVNID